MRVISSATGAATSPNSVGTYTDGRGKPGQDLPGGQAPCMHRHIDGPGMWNRVGRDALQWDTWSTLRVGEDHNPANHRRFPRPGITGDHTDPGAVLISEPASQVVQRGVTTNEPPPCLSWHVRATRYEQEMRLDFLGAQLSAPPWPAKQVSK